MSGTLRSAAMFGLALALPTAIFAQEGAQEIFAEAGFGDVQVMSDVEVARVQGDNGETFFVVSGINARKGPSGTATGGDTSASATDLTGSVKAESDEGNAAPTPPVGTTDLTASVREGMAVDPRSLEERLGVAGIEDFEILTDARVGQVIEGGSTLFVIHGIDD